MSASSFAVSNASRTVARPVSKTPSSASTWTFMATMISTLAILSVVGRPWKAYLGDA
jgi:hypothetical protein